MVVEVIPGALACTKRDGVVDPPSGPPVDAMLPLDPGAFPETNPPELGAEPVIFWLGPPAVPPVPVCVEPTTSEARSLVCFVDDRGRAITAAIRTTNARTPAPVIPNNCAETPRRSPIAFNASRRVVRPTHVLQAPT